jgi:periplasmic divalent cation tolerance protein
MAKTGFIVVFITASGAAEAEIIATRLLEEKLAACVNTLGGLTSRYWWQGRLETAAEHLLVVKTRQDKLAAVTRRVGELHHDAVPEVIALPITGGSAAYLSWLSETLGPPG